VAFAVFTAVWIDLLLRRMGKHGALRALSWCWCAGILYSTLATKQHVAIDVLAGTALGLVAAVLHVTQAKSRSPVDVVECVDPVETGQV